MAATAATRRGGLPDGSKRQSKHGKLIVMIVSIIAVSIMVRVDHQSLVDRNNNNFADSESFGAIVQHLSSYQNESSLEERIGEYQRTLNETKAINGEEHPDFIRAKQQYQATIRELVKMKYGEEPYRVLISVKIPNLGLYAASTDAKHIEANFTIELASTRYIPHAAHSFLETLSNFKRGAFSFVAFHMLQGYLVPFTGPLLFSEYSSEMPHLEGSVGLSGENRFHISLMDNDHNFGPFSQPEGRQSEITTCLGRIIEGYETTVQQMRLIPTKGGVEKLRITGKHTQISSMTLLRK